MQLDLTPRCPVCGEPDADHREPGMVELGVDAVPCVEMQAARVEASHTDARAWLVRHAGDMTTAALAVTATLLGVLLRHGLRAPSLDATGAGGVCLASDDRAAPDGTSRAVVLATPAGVAEWLYSADQGGGLEGEGIEGAALALIAARMLRP